MQPPHSPNTVTHHQHPVVGRVLGEAGERVGDDVQDGRLLAPAAGGGAKQASMPVRGACRWVRWMRKWRIHAVWRIYVRPLHGTWPVDAEQLQGARTPAKACANVRNVKPAYTRHHQSDPAHARNGEIYMDAGILGHGCGALGGCSLRRPVATLTACPPVSPQWCQTPWRSQSQR